MGKYVDADVTKVLGTSTWKILPGSSYQVPQGSLVTVIITIYQKHVCQHFRSIADALGCFGMLWDALGMLLRVVASGQWLHRLQCA